MAIPRILKALVPKPAAQASIIEFMTRVMTEHQKFSSYQDKMEAIDVAYARYKANMNSSTGVVGGQGIDAATTPLGVMNLPSTTPPVVVSQVDSMVGYLADVFLSGTPIFPVVSSPKNKKYAEQLEVLLDDHATLGGYARQLLLFLRDGVKYNFSAIEADWSSIDQYALVDEVLTPGSSKMSKDSKSFTKLKRLDPYNTIWDFNVAPGDVATEGDFAGYVEILSKPKLKRRLQRLANDGKAFNVREALKTPNPFNTAEQLGFYRTPPQVSQYINARRPMSELSWYTWITGQKDPADTISTGNYEYLTLYARIVPKEFDLDSPASRTVQIWKFVLVNSSVLVQAERIISAYDMLPILFGQPLEDGLGYQTQSIAEGNIPFQQAAETLFNISFNAARRAVSDRALYDADLIKPSDINAPVPAPKIPVKSNSLDSTKTIRDAYYQIPFDARGTEGAMDSGMRIVAFGKELSGLNSPMQGQFQKGNKSVQEWQDTMGGADARLRLPALILEYQVFQPLKSILKLNIFQYGDDAEIVSQKSGEVVQININELRKQVLAFRLADGYTPKSKLASTDSLTSLMQIIAQSQQLQVSYGGMLPGMMAHLAQLLGVRGMEEYTPDAAQAQANVAASQAQQQQPQQPQQLPPQGA